MNSFEVHAYGLNIVFLVRDNGIVELASFAPADRMEVQGENVTVMVKEDVYHPLLEVHETGRSTRDMHGYKHQLSGASLDYKYVSHRLEETVYGKELVIDLAADTGMYAEYHMSFYKDSAVVSVYTVLTNKGTTSVPLEYVSSFIYQNLCGTGVQWYSEKTDIYVPYNSWCSESRWQKYDIKTLNLTDMVLDGHRLPGHGLNGFSYSGKSSWSSVDYLPMGIVHDRELDETYIFQIEHSGQWHIEYGSDFGGRLYVALSGATETEHGWWYNLKPGQSYTTVPAAFGLVRGGMEKAIGELTSYRRAVRRPNPDDDNLYVVFNDYMNCLEGDPYEETEIKMIDQAAEMGCEYYCMDAGWYDDGFWWDRVGEWIESPKRFPNGLKAVYDHARAKGMKMGMWLEIEVMGVACRLADTLPDDWFICRHGRRHVDNKRYLLDFRNPKVRQYCTDVVERLIRDYGVAFFKVDYNVSMGAGSDLYTDSPAQSIREHYEHLYQWYRELFERHPDLIVENCGSGGMRMDYGMLKLLSLQSTSDQTDYIFNSYIAANAAAAVTPEQAGVWVYPYKDDREHVIYNFVNGLVHRPYISGQIWQMSRENLGLMAEGVTVYKRIRSEIRRSVPYLPLGFAKLSDAVLAFGVRHAKKAYLAVMMPGCDQAVIPLEAESRTGERKIESIRVIYPEKEDCEYSYTSLELTVKMPKKGCARLFEITYQAK